MGNIVDKLNEAFKNLLGNKEAKVLLIGLDAAGKTSILYKMKLNENIMTIPTIGFNVEQLKYKKLEMTIWDLGGQDLIRRLWRYYYQNTNAIIFVVDAADKDRMSLARDELHGVLSDELLSEAKLLVLANKQDLPGAMNGSELAQKLQLGNLKQRSCKTAPFMASRSRLSRFFTQENLVSRASLIGIGALFGVIANTAIISKNLRDDAEEKERLRLEELQRQADEEKRLEPQRRKDAIRSGRYIDQQFGIPTDEKSLQYYKEFISRVDFERKVPRFVAYTINQDLLNKGEKRVPIDQLANRNKSHFNNKNAETPDLFQCENSDYFHSGFDRGHMSPCSDHPLNQDALDETFYLTANIVPQHPTNNRDYWYRIENYTRALASQYENVHAISGPLYIPREETEQEYQERINRFLNRNRKPSAPVAPATPVAQTSNEEKVAAPADNAATPIPPPAPAVVEQQPAAVAATQPHVDLPHRKVMDYQIIGSNEVHVPTHLYRVILGEKKKQSQDDTEQSVPLALGVFVLPNAHIDAKTPLTEFQKPLEFVERRTGLLFFEKLKDPATHRIPETSVHDLCKVSKCELVPQDVVEMWHAARGIRSAKSVAELHKVWKDVTSKGEPDAAAKQAYDEKMRLLAAEEAMANI